MAAEPKPFDPRTHLSKIGKAEYLEVKWRLVWLREVHPDAILETEAIRLDSEQAIFKATITVPSGGRATAYGDCAAAEFGSYIGKAETVAIGRALAHLGFGTQFAGDLEGPLVDAPVTRTGTATVAANPPKRTQATHEAQPGPGGTPAPKPTLIDPATMRVGAGELAYLGKEATARGIDADAIETEARARWGRELREIDKGQWKDLLSWVKAGTAAGVR